MVTIVKRKSHMYLLILVKYIYFNRLFTKLFLGFTGVDQVYEKPDAPELVLKTVHLSIEESTMQVVQMLEENVSFELLYDNIIVKYI